MFGTEFLVSVSLALYSLKAVYLDLPEYTTQPMLKIIIGNDQNYLAFLCTMLYIFESISINRFLVTELGSEVLPSFELSRQRSTNGCCLIYPEMIQNARERFLQRCVTARKSEVQLLAYVKMKLK